MKTFLHGGRLGDAIYAMYTIKALGGGDVILNMHHAPTGWNVEMANSLAGFMEQQSYINNVRTIDTAEEPKVDYNLIDAERNDHPLMYPEWHGRQWPGNVHLAKRYARQFGVEWQPESIWIEKSPLRPPRDYAVFHAPVRRVTDMIEQMKVLKEVSEKIKVYFIDYDKEWIQKNDTKDLTQTWRLLSGAKFMFGAISSVHAMAEAMGIPRYVQVAPGCDNVIPTGTIQDLRSLCQELK